MQIKSKIEQVKEHIVEKLKKINKKYLYAFVGATILAVAGCHFYGQKNLNGVMPAVNATVAVVKQEKIENPKSYVALVEAINSVDVVAKVSGSMDKVNFVEGSFVKKDDALFVIDKNRYKANYDLAQAQLESAQANLTRTERDYARQKQLSAKNIASKATFDAAESSYLQAKAAVSQAKAQLELAKIDLDNTEVKAYIDGVIGKTKVTAGNYVNASAEPLARVVQVDPIRVAFSLTDKEFLELQAIGKQNLDDFEINIELASGQIIKQKLDRIFANNEINMGTATVAVYADVRNTDQLLKPGAYVRVFVTSSRPKEGLVIPEQAIVQNEGNSFVFVVTEDNIAKMRPVKLGEAYEGKQVIESGLAAGERVMTGGLANRMLRDGALVNIVQTN
ncbi:MAG: efflux RND transporter periplasmic adaptor subunit [Alphaproteobacteria bacterium]|nr:efflux RND transporter periplasmic adaptor subunit [Alphaproteobacteria bacterium]